MVRVGIVDTFCAVNGGAGSTAGSVSVALKQKEMSANASLHVRQSRCDWRGTLDFLFRQATHAVLTHLLFAEVTDAGESLSLLWDLDFTWDSLEGESLVGV